MASLSWCCCCCCKQVETSLWHLHILSPLPSTSESFVACSKKEKKCYINCIHQGSFRHLVMQLSTVSSLPPFPSPLAGRQFVSRQERSNEGNKKRGQQKLSASSSTAPTGGRLRLRLRDLLSLAMRAWAQMKRRQAASAVASARAYL